MEGRANCHHFLKLGVIRACAYSCIPLSQHLTVMKLAAVLLLAACLFATASAQTSTYGLKLIGAYELLISTWWHRFKLTRSIACRFRAVSSGRYGSVRFGDYQLQHW